MPGFLLHVGATVICAHGGQAQPTTPNTRVLVSGQPTLAMTTMHTVAGCTLPPPNAGNGPCASASWTTGATRILSSAQPLLLLDSAAVCVPSGTPLSVVATQTRATGT